MPARKLQPRDRPTVALHDRAMDDLRYIRETMERSGSFTHVSGIGGIAMGVVALLGAWVAVGTTTPTGWIVAWTGTAVVAFAVAVAAMGHKARAAGEPLLSGPGRKFVWGVIPPLLVGGILTPALAAAGAWSLLPGSWLLLYGAGVVSGGAFSVRIIPLMGLTFMAVGAAALLAPPELATASMAAGFGGLHILFGVVIWRKHGG